MSERIELTEDDFTNIFDYDCAWLHMDNELCHYNNDKLVKQILSNQEKAKKWDMYEICINSIRKHTKILCSNEELIGLAQKNFNFFHDENKQLDEMVNSLTSMVNTQHDALNRVSNSNENLKQKLEKVEKWLKQSLDGYTYPNELNNLIKLKDQILGDKKDE